MFEVVVRKLLAIVLLVSLPAYSDAYDIAINYGRVIDPESGLDAIRHIGITGDKVTAVSTEPLAGSTVIDARNLIVAPGFIDLHSHAITPEGQRYQLFDGVTTALELEAGAFPAKRISDQLSQQPLIHYGGSLGYLWLRQWYLSAEYQPSILHSAETALDRDPNWPDLGAGAVFRQTLTNVQIQEMKTLMRHELALGDAIGIGLPIDYLKYGLTDAELSAVFEVAAETKTTLFIHARRMLVGDLAGLNEVISLAEQSGASVHFCHINSNALGAIEEFLIRVGEALAQGVDISIEAYPYEAGSTQIGAAAFKGNWRDLYGMVHEDIVWVETGERLTPESFHDYQKNDPEGYIVLFSNTMDAVDKALLAPQTMVASDAMPAATPNAKVHPRGRGTFAKTLKRYVREQDALSWRDAIAKMTLEPAKRLEAMAPSFAKKGRLQIGADADIVVLDPNTITDKASYENPDQFSEGVRYVLISGNLLINQAQLRDGVFPGQRLDARPRVD